MRASPRDASTAPSVAGPIGSSAAGILSPPSLHPRHLSAHPFRRRRRRRLLAFARERVCLFDQLSDFDQDDKKSLARGILHNEVRLVGFEVKAARVYTDFAWVLA